VEILDEENKELPENEENSSEEKLNKLTNFDSIN